MIGRLVVSTRERVFDAHKMVKVGNAAAPGS